VGFNPILEDRMDLFLMQIVIVNALMESAAIKRTACVRLVISQFQFQEDGQHNIFANVLRLLSPVPSIQTNRKAATILQVHGFHISIMMMQRSVRDNIAQLFHLSAVNIEAEPVPMVVG
jgi:hypothetical protein